MRPLVLQSLLVAIDLTEGSAAAVQTAAAFARLTEARLAVLYAGLGGPDADRSVAEWLHAHAGPDFEPEELRIVPGDPARVIVEEATRGGADVIILGPHRERARRERLGSTADQVVRRAQIPCLVVPQRLPLPMTRVLIPVDLTAAACGALHVGLSWASALRRPSRAREGGRTEVQVIHVATDGTTARDTVHRMVEDVRAIVGDAPGVQIQESVEESDDPAEAILRHLNAGTVDLAVLGTHGTRRNREDVLGSVSSAVVCQSLVPVLLVPPEVWTRNAG